MAFSQSYSDFNSPTVPALTPPSAHSSLGSSFASPPTPFGDLDAILPFTDGAFRGYSDQASAFAAEALTMDPSHLFQPALAIGTPAFPSPPFAVPAALPVSPQAPAPQGRRKRTLTQVESEEAVEVEAKAPKPKKVKKAAPKKAKMIVESDGQGEAECAPSLILCKSPRLMYFTALLDAPSKTPSHKLNESLVPEYRSSSPCSLTRRTPPTRDDP